MRVAKFFLSFTFLCVFYFLGTPLYGQSQTSVLSPEDFLPTTVTLPLPIPYPPVGDLLEAIQRSDNRMVAEVLSRLEAYQERLGGGPLPALASALWNAGGYADQELHDRAIAEQCWRVALKLDPTNPLYYLSYSRFLFHEGPRSWKKALQYLGMAVGALIQRRGGVYIFFYGFGDGLFLWLITIFVALGVVSAVLGYKTLMHDLWEKTGALPKTRPMAQILTYVLMGVPFLFSGFVWGILWLLLLFFHYMSRPMKRWVGGMLIVAMLLPILSYMGYEYYNGSQLISNPWLQDYVTQRNLPEALHRAYQILVKEPANEIATLAYGSFFTKTGRLDQAIAIYTRAIRSGLNSAALYNNLGNAFALQELPRQALLFYDRAEKLGANNPRLAGYVAYNKGRAYYLILEYRQGEESIARAFKLYPELRNMVESESTFLDYAPTRQDVAGQLRGFQIDEWLHLILQDRRFRILVILVLVMFILRVIHWPPYEAKICERCGEAYCRNCQATGYDFPYCSACLHLFVLKDGISPQVRDLKLKQIEIHDKRSRFYNYILHLVLPGSLFTSKNSFILGITFHALWAAGLILLNGLRYSGPFWLDISSVPVLGLLGLLIIFVVYILNGIILLFAGEE